MRACACVFRGCGGGEGGGGVKGGYASVDVYVCRTFLLLSHV